LHPLPPAPSPAPARDALVAAAGSLVKGRYFGNLTHARVGHAAGVSADEVRSLFPARRDLVDAVCMPQHGQWFRSLTTAVSAQADPRDQILAVFAFLEKDAPDCCPCLVVKGGPAGVADALVAGHFVDVEHYMASLCEAAGLPQFLCDSLIVLINGAVVTSTVGASKQPARAARTAAAMLMSVYEPATAF
jgi:AcrR family transcriptional regulator